MKLPAPVRNSMSYGLYLAQVGRKHPNAKPLKGFSGAGVLEVVEDHAGDTYRAVYTLTLHKFSAQDRYAKPLNSKICATLGYSVRFSEVVYVLHAFQKKSKQAKATPKSEIASVRQRLRAAELDYRQHCAAS